MNWKITQKKSMEKNGLMELKILGSNSNWTKTTA